MKTIFITIFEGVEAKNILRTDILPTLLEEKDLRIVLFTKSEDKRDYYSREFSDPRLIYEVVARPTLKGFDKIFGYLKFLLLKTETKDLQRRIKLRNDRNYLSYVSSTILNFLLARASVRRCMRFLDFQLVRNRMYAPYFDTYNPDLVFLAHLFDEPEIHLLREAKQRGVLTIGFINSWDKVTARCMMRLLPNKTIVFNDLVKRDLVAYNEINERDIFVSGIPQYDHYFKDTFLSREDFFKSIGIDPRKQLIVYAPMGKAYSNSDWDIIDLLYAMKNNGEFGSNAELLVRFQPNDFIKDEELQKRPWLIYDYPGKRFSTTRGVDWDMDASDLKHLRNTLKHMSVLICYASSMSIDGVIFGKPVININFELEPLESLSKPATFYYGLTHYKEALATGGIKLVGSKKELISAVKAYLGNSLLDENERARLVNEQCKFTDGMSGKRIGELVLSQL